MHGCIHNMAAPLFHELMAVNGGYLDMVTIMIVLSPSV